MPHLVLVKHSLPEVNPGRPASTWPLSLDGRRRCGPIAAALTALRPAAIVASTEPKATETAWLVNERLGLPALVDARLREHDRDKEGWLEADAFRSAIARLFERPDDRVFGRETARQAETRFSGAVDDVLACYRDGTVVVVAHGTVISLFCARRASVDGFALWGRLGLPSFVVLARPDFRLEAEVAKIPDLEGSGDDAFGGREDAP